MSSLAITTSKYSSVPPASRIMGRRAAIAAAGTVCLVGVAWPRVTRAQTSMILRQLWNGTKWLAEHAIEGAAAEGITSWMASTPKIEPDRTDYHDKWAFPVQFDGRFPLSQTQYNTYFGVNNSPVLTNKDHYENHADLNWAEINGLARQQADPSSALFTAGSRLLPGYTGARRPATRADADELQDKMAADTTIPRGLNLDLSYVRDFCTCNGNVRGYALKRADNPDPTDYRFRIYTA